MAIQIQQEQQGPLRILALAGRLDTETAVDVELALQDLLGAGERQFVIDLAGIGYVSSAGLRVLLGLAKQLDGGKGGLRLCGLNASVKTVFDVAGFSKLFTILPDRAAAIKSMSSSSTQAFKAAQATPPKQEPPTLGQRVALLIGASTKVPIPHPQAAELVKAAAELLGVKHPPPAPAPAKPAPSPAAARPAPAPKAAAPARAAPAPPPAAPSPDPKQGGVLGKLRGLFGGKR